ncbi:MAG: YihY/virulence factor BrkB family protein [Sediminibacterium sp.]
MKNHIHSGWKLLKETFSDFSDIKAMRMSAALAYYTIFSIAPMLIVIISLCDIFYGKAAVEGTIFQQIQDFVGIQAATQIQEVIKNATISKDISWASIVGVVTLVIAATGLFAEIQDSINTIWNLKAKPKKGWLKWLLNRVLSFSMIVSLGFILLVSLVVDSMLDLAGQQVVKLLPGTGVLVAHGINLIITFTTTSFLFGIIFKVLPDARIHWRDVLTGATTTAILFMIGKFVIGYYLGRSHITTSYGAAGSLVIILLWVYYSAIILYFGATFTRVYTIHRGRNIFPNDYAVWVQQIELENKASLQVQEDTILTNTLVSVVEPRVASPEVPK